MRAYIDSQSRLCSIRPAVDRAFAAAFSYGVRHGSSSGPQTRPQIGVEAGAKFRRRQTPRRRPAIATRSLPPSSRSLPSNASSRSVSPISRRPPACRSSQMRGEFASTLAILAAYLKSVDRAVLAEDLADMAEEPPRERLFDVLMRRLEVMAPHREAVRSLLRSARAQSAAGAGAQRARGAVAAMDADRRRHQRLRPARHDARARPRRCCSLRCCAPGSMTTIPGLARTMAALDRALGRGQRLVGLVEDLCQVPRRLCRLRSRWRRRPRRRRGRRRGGRASPPRRDRRLIHTAWQSHAAALRSI